MANRLSTWCYPDLVLAPLNDESAASPAFYSLNMFHKTESPSISLIITAKVGLGYRDRLRAKIAGNIEMSEVSLRDPRTPAVSLALGDWSGVGVSE